MKRLHQWLFVSGLFLFLFSGVSSQFLPIKIEVEEDFFLWMYIDETLYEEFPDTIKRLKENQNFTSDGFQYFDAKTDGTDLERADESGGNARGFPAPVTSGADSWVSAGGGDS